MIKYNKCKTCKELHWNNQDCAPLYLVYFEEYLGDEAKEIRAHSFQEAAEKFGEYYNSVSDYELINHSIEVTVEFENETRYYNISAEPDVYYTSREIEKTH